MDHISNTFAGYGTPLKDLEEDEVHLAKAARVEDQIVTDNKGRRRFHGAFTGGFSAGYFNTVGTKDGWAPSTFVSSRSNKTSDKNTFHQKPQDFMDDEDLESHGIAPQQVKTTSNYDDLHEGRKRKRSQDVSGPIPGIPVLELLLQPNKETIGLKLLRKLGWRIGQGIGPRISKKEKKSLQKEKRKNASSRHLSSKNDFVAKQLSSDSSDEDEVSHKFTYAPDDVDITSLTSPKDNLFGLGYKPLERKNILGGTSFLLESTPVTSTHKNKKLSIRGQAFGVGAFEEDDEDIYMREDMSHYDFELGPEKPKMQSNKKAASSFSFLGLSEKLEGFEISSKPLEKPKVYPLPSIPAGFTPHHRSRKKRFEMKPNEKKGLGRHDLTHEDRRRIIAENPSNDVEVRLGVKESSESELSVQLSLDSDLLKLIEENDETSRNMTDFKPFSKEPEKQKRYDLYIKMKAKGMKDRFHLVQPRTLTDWEKERERMEFQRASELFTPLASSMSLRFTTAKTEDPSNMLKDGLNMEIKKNDSSSLDVRANLGDEVLDDRMKAAKSNMFGVMTQFRVDWAPDNLLCKRFNIPNPNVRSQWVSVPHSSSKSRSIFEFLSDQKAKEPDSPQDLGHKVQRDGQDLIELEEVGSTVTLEGVEEQFDLKVSTAYPPSKDLFKAIFQDSSSDSEEDEENVLNGSTKLVTNTIVDPKPPQNTIKRDGSRWESPQIIFNPSNKRTPVEKSPSPPPPEKASGIFSNLDFNLLNQFRNQSYKKNSPPPPKSEDKSSIVPQNESLSEDEYGPSLPPSLALPQSRESRHSLQSTSSSSSSEVEVVWVQKKKSKKHKHKSKKSKKKKHKKDKKHKSKRN